MLIHSKFSDYYDSASAYGVDTTIHYVRRQQLWSIDMALASQHSEVCERVTTLIRNAHAELNMYFQRNAFPCIVAVGTQVHPVMIIPSLDDYTCCISIEEMAKHSHVPQQFKEAISKPNAIPFWRRSMARRLREFFAPLPDRTKRQLNDMMVTANSPVMLIGPSPGQFDWGAHIVESLGVRDDTSQPVITFNPFLKDYQFARVVDPFTAHQEIMMFLTNQLCINEPNMVEIGDIYKRDGKGFDEKSFKNRGTKKPRRKRKQG